MTSKSRFSSAFRFALTFLMTLGLFSCNKEDKMILTLGLIGALFYWYSKKIKSNGGGAGSKW